MTELKPCPFCGGDVEILYFDKISNKEKIWYQDSDDNGATFPFIRCYGICETEFHFHTPYGFGDAVIRWWNRRT